MKHGLKKSNKTQRNRNKKMNNSRSKSRRRMRGGAYDEHKEFQFPDPNKFNHSYSLITFKTMNANNYIIAKDPYKLLDVLNKINRQIFIQGIGVVSSTSRIDISKYDPIIDNAKIIRSFKNQPSGMFFLYGQNETKSHPQYGLFYLLNRIQLLAVLYKIKTTPGTIFGHLQVELPITHESRLPPDYNKSPHGYFFNVTVTKETEAEFAKFVTFVKQMNQLNQYDLRLPLNKDAIDALTIPPFLQMMRMQNATIFTEVPEVPETPETPETDSTLQTNMNELDGGRRRTNRTFNKIKNKNKIRRVRQ